MPSPWRALLSFALIAILVQVSGAYSVLTHEQIVDLLWKDQIRPMIEARYPGLTPDQIREAHAYAYGGSLVQDMGYYPFGNKYFSDLTHYVRSGDFVAGMMQEAQNPNEYAFALGALAHYAADNDGHPAVNRAVAMEFPALRKKYGDVVTYEDSHSAHIRTEFGFDMTEVAKNHYTSDAFHDFIGFEISQSLLERTFPKVYGVEFNDVIHNEDLAIGTFRHAVSQIIPQMTRVALLARTKELVPDKNNGAKKKYLYYLSRADYQREWGRTYRHPGFGTRVLAVFLKIIPKRGPFNALGFKVPPQPAEDLFVKSIDSTLQDYGKFLDEARKGTLQLEDKDFDTGHETRPGEYALADQTYARLVGDLAKSQFKDLSPPLRENIETYYSNSEAPLATKRHPKQWRKLEAELEQLKDTPAAESSGAPGLHQGSAPPELKP
jgi:Zinc dependent phospholipase C